MIKSVIVRFNLPVFLLLSPSPFPPLDKIPHWWHIEAELADTSSLIIRLLESTGPSGLCRGHGRESHTAGMWTGTGGGGRLWEKVLAASSLSPLLHSFLQERLLAKFQQQLWILRHVLFGRCDYFLRKNIFIDKTLCVVRSCFARFFVLFANPWRALALPPDLLKIHNSDVFVFQLHVCL